MLSTQRRAWEYVKENLTDRQKTVYYLLAEHKDGLTSKETARFLGVELNTISGRFSELKDLDLIKGIGIRKNPNGRDATIWAIKKDDFKFDIQLPFPKRKRIEDQNILERYRNQKCCVEFCVSQSKSDPHHIKSVGAFGDDVDENIVPLCRWHHNDIHNIGVSPFLRKWGVEIKSKKKLYDYIMLRMR